MAQPVDPADAVFVARERELARLHGCLDEALAGRGAVAFVTGEAGTGKTTLVAEFARRALERDEDLLVAHGACNARTGIGDPYLPFREVLAMLVGEVDEKLAQGTIPEANATRLRAFFRHSGEALIDLGPLLVNTLVPGSLLAAHLGRFVAKQLGWTERLRAATAARKPEAAIDTDVRQAQIFEQYTEVLQALAARRPLLLWLDDLHWVDPSSAGLLFHLGRALQGSRILIVGSYRPEEVALGRLAPESGARQPHPMQAVVAELKRYRGELELPLDDPDPAEGRRFVDALLDTESNVLSAEFREALHRHTGGHPLFTAELLRDMQERGVIVRSASGRWIEAAAIDWELLPARVEGVIETRVDRLDEALRDTLSVASVEGERFTAEVVARLRELPARDLVRLLSGELDKRHRLVRAEGVQRAGAQRLSLYRFRHNLIYRYLYRRLDEAERAYLHEDVGRVLEELHAGDTAPVAALLAAHFERAGLADEAVEYLRQAAEVAAAAHAHEEAAAYLDRALALLPDDAREARLELLLAREEAHGRLGDREAQEADLEALDALVGLREEGAEAPVTWKVRVLQRRASYFDATTDYAATVEAAREGVALAEGAGMWREAAALIGSWGHALLQQGRFPEAQERLEVGRAHAERAGAKRELAAIVRALGVVLHHRADFARTRERFEEALALYREIGDRRGEVICLNNVANVARDLGDFRTAHASYREGIRIAEETRDRSGEGKIRTNLGGLLLEEGNLDEARLHLEEALRLNRALRNHHFEGVCLENLALVAMHQGDHDRARALMREFLDLSHAIGFQVGEGGALASLGRLALRRDDLDEAEARFRQALALHRELEQPHFVLDDQAGLARVALRRGDLAQAREHLAPLLEACAEDVALTRVGDPYEVFLACGLVLAAAGERQRAREIVAAGHARLRARAEALASDEDRERFWRLPLHAELRDLALELDPSAIR